MPHQVPGTERHSLSAAGHKNQAEMKEYKFKINGHEYNVTVNGIEGKTADLTVNGVSYSVELENEPAAAVQTAAPVSATTQASPAPTAPAAPAVASGTGKTVTSPLPGVIIGVEVKEGDSVKRGQKVAVIEAMKMENDILASADGTISKVFVNKGDSVLEGANIVTING